MDRTQIQKTELYFATDLTLIPTATVCESPVSHKCGLSVGMKNKAGIENLVTLYSFIAGNDYFSCGIYLIEIPAPTTVLRFTRVGHPFFSKERSVLSSLFLGDKEYLS